jgi:tetratricopeptide (TPR) repeat protein
VTQAVQQAEQLMSRTSWLEAKSALSRADGLLVTGRANDELRERVQQLHRDLAMLDRLYDIREADASMLDGVHDYVLLDQRYEQAFREYGIEPLPGGWWSSPRDPSSSSTANLNPAAEPGSRRLDPSHPVIDRAAEQIEHRTIQHELIAALDHWSVVRRRASEPGVSRILAVARAADSDDLRNRIRDCLERNDREELFDASSSAELAKLPTATALLLASALSEAGDRERAVAVLRIAQHRNPSDRGVNLLLAGNLHDLSRWDEMQHFAGVAHALRPTGGAARLAVADALRHKGSLDESASLCEEVIQLNADNPHAYHMLGLVREDQTEWSDAATQFRHAIELYPAYVEAHNHLGRCLTRQGEIDAAIAALQHAIELKPTYAGPHENLGVALWRKGQFDEAIAELQKAIELDPNSAQAHTDLGAILVRRGQVTTGIEEHRRAIALNPNSAEAHINLGNAFRLQNDLDSAAAEYRTAIDLKPHLAAPRWNLAQTLLDQAKFAEALVQLQYGHDMSLRDRYGPYPWTARLRESERMLELEGRLPEVLAGSEPVANAAERADFGMLCYTKRLYATAARFYEQAFADDPALADDAEHPRRYTAAC